MKILFLDVDGVLNAHGDHHVRGRALIRPECAAQLQRVIDRTDAGIVVSSAWRYQVLRGAMTLEGFQHMLRSHGILATVIGVTAPGTQQEYGTGQAERVGQILEWLDARGNLPCAAWAVVDDAKLSLADPTLPIVETDGAVGLTERDADRLIELLGRKPKPRCRYVPRFSDALQREAARCELDFGHPGIVHQSRGLQWTSDQIMEETGEEPDSAAGSSADGLSASDCGPCR